MNIRPDIGEVYLSDEEAGVKLHHEGDPEDEPGNNLYGNLKQLFLLKKANRNLKVLLSIGGWAFSPSLHPVVVSPVLRQKFVLSAIKILEDREITNAGYGSNLAIDGTVECDAVVVDHNGRSGGIGACARE